jgi:hypothetical protein
MVIEDGGLDPATVRTMRGLVEAALRDRGVTVTWHRRLEEVRPPDDITKAALQNIGASTLFALQVGRLGSKLILTLQQRSGERLDSVFSASLPAAGPEEADRVLPRLVGAVIERRPATEGATLRTVTADEARPLQQKQSAKLFSLGLTFGFNSSAGRTYTRPFGVNAALSYEIEHWRVDLVGIAEGHGSSSTAFLGLGGTYLFMDGDISPYVSAALGYSALGGAAVPGGYDDTASGAAATVGAGLEFLRLHNFRLMVGADLLIPFYDTKNIQLSSPVSPLLHLRMAF